MSAVIDPGNRPGPSHVGNNAGSGPRPIPFPSRPHVEELCRTRANGDNARWQHQAEQRATLIAAARAEGFDAGERKGYTQGWHWGLVCGAVAGATAVGLAWGVWATWGLA